MTMRRHLGTLIVALTVLALPGVARAQQSASYRLSEHTLNEGGHPAQGVVLSSASFRVRLDAIGDGATGARPGSASFHLAGGFVGAYPPPGEVRDLTFASSTVLSWDPEKSVGTYDLYRDGSSTFQSSFGICLASGLTATSAGDAGNPPFGSAYFYLVTAKNLLGEEGTKGYESSGAERPNLAPCP
jgi:hypothetical protein